MDVRVEWKGGMRFESTTPSGGRLVFDNPDGPTPMEGLLVALAACSGIDVVSILEKKRQRVTRYDLEVTGLRPPEGTFPRPFTHIKVRHTLAGVGLDPTAVARAVELSEQKYCSVSMTLQKGVTIESDWVIEE